MKSDATEDPELKLPAKCGNNTLKYCLSECRKLDAEDLPNLWCRKLKDFINLEEQKTHKQFKILDYENCGSTCDDCSNYLLTLEREGKKFSLEMELPDTYHGLADMTISLKDDSWLDEHLKPFPRPRA